MEINKYQNGKIYKIVDVGYNKCYIGSTCKPLSKRMAQHRYIYKATNEGKPHRNIRANSIFDEFGLENCKIELIEEYPCDSKEQLLQREGYHIKNIECINKNVMGRTRSEYNIDNKDYIAQRCHKYYETHKDEISKHSKQYASDNKDAIKEYKHKYYVEHKDEISVKKHQYNINNKETLSEYFKQYYLKNQEHKLSYARTKHDCSVCNGKYTTANKVRHEKSPKHLLALQTLNVENK